MEGRTAVVPSQNGREPAGKLTTSHDTNNVLYKYKYKCCDVFKLVEIQIKFSILKASRLIVGNLFQTD